ncbi:MAG: hypothetical protein GY847_37765 [Proteobacteria bacterium]|nr:hypothetical protein [Pseudomonadota bacterium]
MYKIPVLLMSVCTVFFISDGFADDTVNDEGERIGIIDAGTNDDAGTNAEEGDAGIGEGAASINEDGGAEEPANQDLSLDLNPEPFSEEKALHLSLWSTLGGSLLSGAFFGISAGIGIHSTGSRGDATAALLIVAMLIGEAAISVGPSVGHFYCGNKRHGWLTFTGRLVSIKLAELFFILGAVVREGPLCLFDCPEPDDDYVGSSNLLYSLAALSSISAVVLVVYDFATAKRSVRRANDKLKEKNTKAKVLLLPSVFPGENDRKNYGLMLLGTF